MAEQWRNWSGSLRFTPGRVEVPENEQELAAIVRGAAEKKETVRVFGAGHSSTPLVETNSSLVSLARFQGLVSVDRPGAEAVLRTGMLIRDAGRALLENGLALANMGDIDMQTVMGAMSTCTHGTGKRLQMLGMHIMGVRFVNGSGEVAEKRFEDDPEFFRAARVSLGVLGIFTQVRLRLVPAYRLRRRELCAHTDVCLSNLYELESANRNFDFYWYPRSDVVKIRTMNLAESEPGRIDYAKCVEDRTGWSNEIFPKKRTLRFDEMEYAVPAEAALACFKVVRERIKRIHRRTVGWRLLYRTVAPDDSYLSFTQGRPVVTISLHQNNTLPFREYFDDIEPVFRDHGGRPHWGKKHSLTADTLEPLYPRMRDFLRLRKSIDPVGVFLNPYLHKLLGAGGKAT